ncbi:MAG: NAD(P)-dependent oxidoreductase [Gammaproteobacteria bacterium]
MQTTIGMVGIGLMGHGIAGNILKAGWPLGFLDHPGNQDCADLRDAGAQSHVSFESLAAASEVIIICVTGSPEVEAVVLGGNGLLKHLNPGTTVIDCSTAIPESTREIARAVEAAGCRFMDAPMTRTPREAEQGRLNLIVGGDAELLREHRPLLESFAENIAHAGPVGSGHVMKLVHNFVSLGFSAVLSEAACTADAAGIDKQVLVDVLAAGGGAGVVLDRLSPYVLSGSSDSFRFSLANAHKDLGYYLSMAQQLNSTREAASAIESLYARAHEQCAAGAPVPELIDHLKKTP